MSLSLLPVTCGIFLLDVSRNVAAPLPKTNHETRLRLSLSLHVAFCCSFLIRKAFNERLLHKSCISPQKIKIFLGFHNVEVSLKGTRFMKQA